MFPTPLTHLYSSIAGYVTDRRSAHTAHNVNNSYRNQLSCSLNCPAGQKCYPAGYPAGAGDGCIIGHRRPDRPHCCHFSTDDTFIATVREMHRHAVSASTNRGPASLEFIYELGSLIHSYMDNHSFFGFMWYFGVTITPSFVILPLHLMVISPAYDGIRTDLLTLASKLFKRVDVNTSVAFPWIETVHRSIRYDRDHFFTLSEDITNPYQIPVNVLDVASNVRVSCPNPRLTEQDLFDIVVAKLRNNRNNSLPGTFVIDTPYTGAGVSPFSAITNACINSAFRGRIICGLQPGTETNTGSYSGITVAAEAANWTQINVNPDVPLGFGEIRFLPRALIISR